MQVCVVYCHLKLGRLNVEGRGNQISVGLNSLLSVPLRQRVSLASLLVAQKIGREQKRAKIRFWYKVLSSFF